MTSSKLHLNYQAVLGPKHRLSAMPAGTAEEDAQQRKAQLGPTLRTEGNPALSATPHQTTSPRKEELGKATGVVSEDLLGH